MRALLPWTTAPLVIGGFTALTWALVRQGVEPLLAFIVTSSAAFGALLLLERALPYRPAWNTADGQLANDIGHTLLGTALGARLGSVVTSLAFGGLGVSLAPSMAGGPWPSSWPFALQLLVVFLVADLGRWTQHRLHHAIPFLWRFHALHHDIEKLSAFKNSRSHIVERFLQQIFMFGPLVALGAPADVLYWFMVPNSFLGMLDHANVDARLGVLEMVITGPATHRLHHSRDLREGSSNFGSALVVWDMIFGTWINPLKHPGVAALGVAIPEPTGFIAQLVHPFVPERALSPPAPPPDGG